MCALPLYSRPGSWLHGARGACDLLPEEKSLTVFFMSFDRFRHLQKMRPVPITHFSRHMHIVVRKQRGRNAKHQMKKTARVRHNI